MASNVLFLLVFLVSDLDFAFTLFWNFVSDCVCTVFVVDDFGLDIDLVNNGLLFSGFSVEDFLLLFLW